MSRASCLPTSNKEKKDVNIQVELTHQHGPLRSLVMFREHNYINYIIEHLNTTVMLLDYLMTIWTGY